MIASGSGPICPTTTLAPPPQSLSAGWSLIADCNSAACFGVASTDLLAGMDRNRVAGTVYRRRPWFGRQPGTGALSLKPHLDPDSARGTTTMTTATGGVGDTWSASSTRRLDRQEMEHRTRVVRTNSQESKNYAAVGHSSEGVDVAATRANTPRTKLRDLAKDGRGFGLIEPPGRMISGTRRRHRLLRGRPRSGDDVLSQNNGTLGHVRFGEYRSNTFSTMTLSREESLHVDCSDMRPTRMEVSKLREQPRHPSPFPKSTRRPTSQRADTATDGLKCRPDGAAVPPRRLHCQIISAPLSSRPIRQRPLETSWS